MEPQVQVEEINSVKRKVTVNVPVTLVAQAMEEAVKKVSLQASFKGFRPGKVPRHLVEQHYRHDIESQAMEALFRETFPNALEHTALRPLAQPQIEPTKLLPTEPFIYAAVFEVRPQLTIEKYDDLTLTKEERIVTDADIAAQLEAMRASMTQLVPVADGTALADGMVARIDFDGTADGKPFEGSSAKDFVVDIGGGNLLPEFEQALLGLTMGAARTIRFQYPEEYFNVNLSGSQAEFSVTLTELKRKELPVLDDEFAKDMGEHTSLNALKESIKARLSEHHEREQQGALGQQVITQLLERYPFEVPETMVGWELHAMHQQMTERAKAEGRTLEEMGLTPEAFVKEYEASARQHVRAALLMDAVAQAQALVAEETDVDARLQEISEQVGDPLPKVRLYYEQKNLIGALKEEILREKSLAFIIKQSKIKIEKPKKDSKGVK